MGVLDLITLDLITLDLIYLILIGRLGVLDLINLDLITLDQISLDLICLDLCPRGDKVEIRCHLSFFKKDFFSSFFLLSHKFMLSSRGQSQLEEGPIEMLLIKGKNVL